jgi:winged helix domain-containing protein/ATPase family protein associated with various cellular activities (AAA)
MSGNLLADLRPAFEALDRRLAEALEALGATYGPDAESDPYRGAFIGERRVRMLLSRELAAPGLGTTDVGPSMTLNADSRLGHLARTFQLSAADVWLLVIALAPEIDSRYGHIYGYLQDDVSRRRPTVEFALDLLCGSAAAKIAGRTYLATSAPLRRSGLMHLSHEGVSPLECPPLLERWLIPDDVATRFVLGHDGADPRLSEFAELVVPPRLGMERSHPSLARALSVVLKLPAGEKSDSPWRLGFECADRAASRSAAEAVAYLSDRALLVLDAARLVGVSEPSAMLRTGFRQASLFQWTIYIDQVHILTADDHVDLLARLLEAIDDYTGTVVLGGARLPLDRPPWMLRIEVPAPGAAIRRELWQAALDTTADKLDPLDVSGLADRFKLTATQIENAVDRARGASLWRAAETDLAAATPTANELYAAARAQSTHHLGDLARKIVPRYQWSDLVLPPDRLEQLREICNAARFRAHVHEMWGFEARLSRGKGLGVLFAGPSGTGKTMAAEIMACELGLDLYQIDLSLVVSKYIGETEKNLGRVFDEAETSNAILFFDEADALFGRRGEVKDSHDRYANIEISYLLQRMEAYDGMAILATNLRKNLDEAFVRRLQYAVEFPLPAASDRRRIWQTVWPATVPVSPNADFELLAQRYDLPGGNIRNIALAASFLAAADGQEITMLHLLQATRREYQKLGKLVQDADFAEVR